ncbi:hypothetical protein HK414_25780 [Ramlibacter terrae]|uniref:YDG domain-containing protein n=1 Tax=Ramlibacter terrae TaxID=2732511 RepID=A0ABX6P5X5_9BURK|nr:hypothetical protein HK414_25780 [Ramlibacter terrae]
MGNGAVTVAGTLDASAPGGGHGGFIETSAARVRVQPGARVTTAAARGRTGEWLIDPQDFTIGGGASDNISGATLSALLVTSSVVITTAPGPDATTPGTPPVRDLHTSVVGNGDIHVNQPVSWVAAPNNTTLTLNATRDVNINRPITAVNGNFVACCGRDINVNAAITTTRGSVLLSAGRNFTLDDAGAMTTTDGNLMICAANDIRIGGAMTLTRGTVNPARSLGLPAGMVLSAGIGGNGPGAQAGTVVFEPLTPPVTVTGPNAEVVINYNPVAYNAPTNYGANFTLTAGANLTQRMLVYADGPAKIVDGTTATVLTGLKGAPAGVQLVAGPGAVANFDTAAVGTGKGVTFSGYTLAGADAGSFALPVACCGPAVARTTGTIGRRRPARHAGAAGRPADGDSAAGDPRPGRRGAAAGDRAAAGHASRRRRPACRWRSARGRGGRRRRRQRRHGAAAVPALRGQSRDAANADHAADRGAGSGPATGTGDRAGAGGAAACGGAGRPGGSSARSCLRTGNRRAGPCPQTVPQLAWRHGATSSRCCWRWHRASPPRRPISAARWHRPKRGTSPTGRCIRPTRRACLSSW